MLFEELGGPIAMNTLAYGGVSAQPLRGEPKGSKVQAHGGNVCLLPAPCFDFVSSAPRLLRRSRLRLLTAMIMFIPPSAPRKNGRPLIGASMISLSLEESLA